MCRHCEERSDVAISNRLIPLHEIAALRSRPEGWQSHPEEVLLGCNDGVSLIHQRFPNTYAGLHTSAQPAQG